MNEALQKHLEKLGKALADGDVKAAGGSLSEMTAWAKAEGEKSGYVMADEYKGAMLKLRTDVDAACEQIRNVQKAGLSLRGGAIEGPRTREERMGMLRDNRCFQSEEQARRFAAWIGCAVLQARNQLDTVRPYARDMYKDVQAVQAKADMDIGVAGTGGTLIPNEFVPELIRNVEAEGTLFPLCRRVPLATMGTTTYPTRSGGLTAYWTAPSTQGQRTAPTFSTVALTPEKLMALVAWPNEFLRGNMLADLGQFLGVEIVYAVALAMDNALVNGDGTATYGGITGILQSANIPNVAATATHDLMAEITYTDVGAVIAGLAAGYALPNARWGMSLSVKSVLRNIRATTGVPLYDRGGNGEPANIDGYPYTLSPRMTAASSVAASTKYCFFGDLRLSHFVGIIRAIQIDTSAEALFESDMSLTRGLVHTDIAEADANALVTGKSGTT